MILHQDIQGSEGWHKARSGCCTASMFSDARSRLKKTGEFNAASRAYAFRLALERIGKKPLDDGMETWAMRRGRELEPQARAIYSRITRQDVLPAGFCTTDDVLFGASADGFIGTDKGLEIKCLVDPARIHSVLVKGDVSEFLDQIQGGMWITGRSSWDFVLFLPQLVDVGRSIFMRTIQRDDGYIRELKQDLHDFNAMVEEYRAGVCKNMPVTTTEAF